MVDRAADNMTQGNEVGPKMSIQKLAGRLLTIAAVVTGHLFTGIFQIAVSRLFPRRGYSRASVAHYVRLTLQDLGPTFVKLGQVLATRSDIVPVEWQRELSQLRDHASTLPQSVITSQLEQSLEASPSNFFKSFEPQPAACASIALVHRATLADGRRVAVKIRRPDIQAVIDADLSLVRGPLRLVVFLSRRARAYNFVGLLDEFATLLRSETDFVAEARNIETLRTFFDGDERVSIPQVITPGSGDSVLIMEWIEGVPLSDSYALDDSGLDRRTIAGQISHAFATMSFRAPLFHADPQPSNLLAMSDGRLGIVDFGEVGQIDPGTRAALINLVGSVITNNVEGLADAVLTVSRSTRSVDRGELGKQLDWLVKPVVDAELGNIKLGETLKDLLGVLQRFGLHLPVELALLIKTLITCEATCLEIDPSFQMARLMSELEMASSTTSTSATGDTPAAPPGSSTHEA